jgi:hypothetical protein
MEEPELIDRRDILSEMPDAPFWFLEPTYCRLTPESEPKPIRKVQDYRKNIPRWGEAKAL